MFKLQKLLFEEEHSRLNLMNYISSVQNTNFKISIYRNHSFEMIEHTIGAYLDFAKINVEFEYSDYDDSLSFLNLDLNSDMLILWLDISRYSNDNIENFITERLNYLTQIYKKNILFVPFEANIKIRNDKVIMYNLNKIKTELGTKYKDERLEKFSGTKISPQASMKIAEDLGLNFIPACLMPCMKAIVFDLDNTLYKGVLGEDGYENIILTDAHKKLQEKIVTLAKNGFFVCIASKNNENDVLEMFKNRPDFPLQLENITKLCVSWNSKSNSIKEIQNFLNIGIKDMLFVDDNIGEIMSVSTECLGINTILANDDANITLNILNNYPRMLKLNLNHEDSIRQKDTQSNEQRELLKNTLSKEDFLKSLNIEITYSINNKKQQRRIVELANKTNQFICSYKRYSEKEIEYLMTNKSTLIISVALKDKLSDSGIIGVLVFVDKAKYIIVEECFISCRALGRGIDSNIILTPIKLACDYFHKKQIKFNFKNGDRNEPAESFIDENLKQVKNKVDLFVAKVDERFIKVKVEGNN